MKKIITYLLAAIFYLYVFSVMIFASYFNWTYAKNNGFTKWILLGEVVSTGKSLVWPYFIRRESGNLSKSYPNTANISNFNKFLDTLSYSQKATKIINAGSGWPTINNDDMSQIISFEKQSLEKGKNVAISDLDNVYPNLGINFLNKFLNGLNLIVEGYDKKDTVKLVEGQKLKSEWDDWYVENFENIKKAINQ